MRMKIALLASTFLPRIGGAELMVHQLACQLVRMGHDVHVITWWGFAQAVRRRAEWSLPYRLHGLPPRTCDLAYWLMRKGWPFGWVAWPAIAWLQWRYRFDVWHIHHTYPGAVVCGPALRRLRCPTLITCHGSDIQMDIESKYGERLNPTSNRLIIAEWQRVDRIAVINRAMREDLIREGIDSAKINLIPNGIDLQRFQARSHAAIQSARARLQIPEDIVVLLTVGRNHPIKNYQLIPDVLLALKADRERLLWLVIGQDCESVQQKAHRLGVSDMIRCQGTMGCSSSVAIAVLQLPSDALIDIYRLADIFVLPSRTEGMPLVIMEAMAAGLPVVTTTGPGCGEFVEEGETGFTVPVDDSHAMAERIARLIEDDRDRMGMGQSAERQAKQWDWAEVAHLYCEAYINVGKK